MKAPIPRRPRRNGPGARLTVLKERGAWQVWYVCDIDDDHIVWRWDLPGHTTDSWIGDVAPFVTWGEAMAHAATLRTHYGDQCRCDNLLFDRDLRVTA